MHIKRQIFLGLLLFGSILGFADNVIDEIIWVVGDTPILKSEIEQTKKDLRLQGNLQQKDCNIPEQIAIQKLYIHQAELDSIDVSDSQVADRLNYYQNLLISRYGSEEKFEEYEGVPLSQWRNTFKTFLKNRILSEEVQRNLVKDIRVTPAEVRKYAQSLPTDSLPLIPEQVEVQILSLTPQAPQDEIDRIEAKLREYTARVNSGESSFATLAKLYSQDGSARNGGELGFSTRSTFVPEFADIAFTLTDPKKVSRIVKTDFGYHILQLIEKKGDLVNVRHILLKPEVPDSIFKDNLNKLAIIKKDIDSCKLTFEKAVAEYSEDKYTKNNRGIMINNSNEARNQQSRFEMKDLPTDVAFAIENLKVGEVSNPFVLTTQRGQKVIALAKLKERIPIHKASVKLDLELLSDMLLSQKRQKFLDQWIKEKQKNTYIRISKGWENCDFQYPDWIK